MITPATIEKRKHLAGFTERELAPCPAIKGVVGIGSVATGQAHANSDIDAVVFMDPLDHAEYMERVKMLRALFSDILTHITAAGVYTEDPIGEAFVRRHQEPGRSANIAAWNAEHLRRFGTGM